MSSTVALKVAIVEDQPRIRESLRILIGGTDGFRCTAEFESMEDALAKIGGDLPDVALVDIGLPGMNGYDVVSAFRALPELRGLRLIALSGYGQEVDLIRSREAGFEHHFVKPVDFDALKAHLHRAQF